MFIFDHFNAHCLLHTILLRPYGLETIWTGECKTLLIFDIYQVNVGIVIYYLFSLVQQEKK